MSMCACKKCGDIYDTDFEMEVDVAGDCICDECWEKIEKEREINFGCEEEING